MDPIRREIRRLTALATPVALTQLLAMLMWTVDLLMVGPLGVQALNAVSLGRLWVMGTTVLAMGLIFGVDPIASQAHGARDRARLSRALLHVVVVALGCALPLGGLWMTTGRMLVAFGQDPATADLAHRYVVAQLPGLPFHLLFLALKQYLQARGIVRPAMWMSFAGNLFNAGLNAVLIYGLLGAPRLGVIGASISTAITEVVMCGGVVIAMRRFRLQRGSATILDPRQVRRSELREVLRLGLPVAVTLVFEYWAFAGATLLAGRLGAVELAAHSVALNLASISYMVPLGIALGATTRVGHRIGAGDRAGAQRSAWVALGLGAAVMSAFALVFIAGRRVIPAAYGAGSEVVAVAAGILPIVAAFELFDGLQVVGSGILRGMGRTRPAAAFNFIGYYVFGMPLAIWLGRPERLGLAGIWWGLALGLFAVAVALVAWIAVRGPRTVPALVSRSADRGGARGTG
jgi:MATE family multidrug resistance protein